MSSEQVVQCAQAQSNAQRFIAWVQEPAGSVIAASIATIGTFVITLSGIWAINLAVSWFHIATRRNIAAFTDQK